jgi:hypothetical protein
MAVGLTLRAWLALLAVTVLIAASSALALGSVAGDAAGAIGRQSRQSVHSSPVRLRDVGDAWRALLLGAPPALL